MRVRQIDFTSGATGAAEPLRLQPGRITLFIGPNNGGKSQALRDIASKFTGHFSGVVLSNVDVTPFSDTELEAKISTLTRPKLPNEDPNPRMVPIGKRGGYNVVNLDQLRGFASNPLHYHVYANWFLQHLIMNLGGENRLGLAQACSSVPLREPANSTIAMLLRENDLRAQLSDLVFQAFGQYLVIDSTGMHQIQYALSPVKPPNSDLERSFTEEAAKFFDLSRPLSLASDGTKAFVGIMGEVLAGDHEVLLIDEPEAFLHPSLAYSLGKEISQRIDSSKQLFAATHSPHFMMGCIDSGVGVDIVRLTHSTSRSTARILPNDDLKVITSDPLLKSIGVTSALFYQEAIVCEADADRAFYAEIASRLVDRKGFRHSVFLNGYGKQTMPGIVRALRSLGIPTIGIMDLDWIKEDGAVVENYMKGFDVPEGMKEAFRSARRSVRASLEVVDSGYKRNGGMSLLGGEGARASRDFATLARRYGIFTVENGELESWLSSTGVSRSKSKWLQEVFFALGSDPQSDGYIHAGEGDVWDFLKDIGDWLETTRQQ